MEDSLRMKLEEQRLKIRDYREKLTLLHRLLEIAYKEARYDQILKIEEGEDLWQSQGPQKAQKLLQEKARLKEVIDSYVNLKSMLDDYDVLEEFSLNGDDEASGREAIELFLKVIPAIDSAEQKVLLSNEMDFNNAIVSINSGAGGTESCDWALMLSRMVVKWSEKKRFKIKTLDVQDGETAGIKSVTLLIEGNYAFGLLKSETGIHRLVRVSPFDSNGRRHTSFASIFVSPELDDDIEIEIIDKDLKIDVYRAGGAGGQSVNTTDSAVRITHLPTGIVVTCQNERSQLQNKLFAMKVLKSRLYEREMAKKKAKQQEIEGEKKEIGWGSQIRSYVLHPYKLVKDHRTGFDVGTAEKVLDGDIDDFIFAYLQWSCRKGEKTMPTPTPTSYPTQELPDESDDLE